MGKAFLLGIGGGNGGSGGTDVSDATALASDIRENKTAYTSQGKLIGTFSGQTKQTDKNGIIVPDLGKYLTAVEVTVPNGYGTEDATATANDILLGKTAYVDGNKVVGVKSYTTQNKSITPSSAEQIVHADDTFDALHQVSVLGDSNLTASNIKKNVQIFGITGSYESTAVLGDITITQNGTYTPDDNTDGFSAVTVDVPVSTIFNYNISVIDDDLELELDITDGDGSAHYNISTSLTNNNAQTLDIMIANPSLQPITIKSNGVYSAEDGVDGYSVITVDIPASSVFNYSISTSNNGNNETELDITDGDGSAEYNISSDCYNDEQELLVVSANPSVQPITITQNGVYNVPDTITGYNCIDVNVHNEEISYSALDTLLSFTPSVTSGVIDSTIKYFVKSDRVLYIIGYGTMPQYNSDIDKPWYQYLSQIDSIYISSSILNSI